MNPNPKRVVYTPAAVSANGIAAALTGAGPFATFVLPGASDSLEHQVALASTADLSATGFTITGTDANGNVISEVHAGPNNNSVLSVKYFKTVTLITASVSLGANTLNVGWGAPARTRWEQIDYRQNSFAVSTALALTAGSISYNLEHTYDPLTDSNAASAFIELAAQTTSRDVQFVAPVMGVRANILSNTGATFTHYAVQGERA
jgi:hypothetical protein